MQSYNPDKMLIEQFQRAMVVGAGATGYSVVDYLSKNGFEITVVDSRATPPTMDALKENFKQVICQFGDWPKQDFDYAPLLVVSPGVSLKEPFIQSAKQQGCHTIGDIDLFLELNKANNKPLIGITGSNGKSTVTTLVGEMCAAAGLNPLVAGNIGLPVLDAIEQMPDYDVAILELSSFQLEAIKYLGADVVTILNVSADHMDRYESMGEYVLAKSRIFRGAKQVVLPRHQEQLRQISSASNCLTFELDEPANDSEFGIDKGAKKSWLVKGKQRLVKQQDIQLMGQHNIKNVLAAFALVDFLKLPLAPLVDCVKSFQGLAHRMQTVAKLGGVVWINDSKATNIGAAATALTSLDNNIIWIAGGQSKGADFSELQAVVTDNIKSLIVFGEDADLLEKALSKQLQVLRVNNMSEAVEKAGEQAQSGEVVLFSPACASFDMYQNFQQRGEDFIANVSAWAKRGTA